MIRETGPYNRFNPKSRETFISGTNDRGRRRRNILFSLRESVRTVFWYWLCYYKVATVDRCLVFCGQYHPLN